MLARLQQQGDAIALRICKRAVVAHAHAVGMAFVHHHLAGGAQALRKGDVARQQARNEQGGAGLVHGMQIQQMGGAFDKGAQGAGTL